MNDVYAGDDDLGGETDSVEPQQAFTFHIVADADPDVLLRVASQFLLSNVVPYALSLKRVPPASVRIDAELRGIIVPMAESIRRKLAQLSCTVTVEISRVL